MPSDKGYFAFIKEQLGGVENFSWRAMMGEYILYYRGMVVGGIYDDRFLVKATKSASAMMPDAMLERPYDRAKEMLLVTNVDEPAFLGRLLLAVYGDLSFQKKKR